ncbi:MAG: MerR family transcriptional regulator [Rhodocyclaceae bacterium]|nr:MerR family transcriptional regulator [Rhodocyclaceae bacterium]
MTQDDILTGVLLEDTVLTLEELAQACAVEPRWILERVEAGFLGGTGGGTGHLLVLHQRRAGARPAAGCHGRDFDANLELAALVADPIEEVARLKGRLKAAGLATD